MFLLSPSFTLVFILFLGEEIYSSPLFHKSFINPEASEEIGMMEKRSSNPFSFFLKSFVDLEALKKLAARQRDPLILTPHPNAYAYGFNFGKIRGGFQPTQKRNYGFAYGFNFGRLGQTPIMKILKKSYIPNSPIFWNPKRVKGWFYRSIHPTNKANPVPKKPAENPRRSNTSAGFRFSYGRSGVSYGRS